MVAGLLVLVIFAAAVWLIFFKLKLLKFSVPWAVVCAIFGAHLLLIFVVGLRFSTPYSMDARVVQYTIQLIPRLPEPTLVTAVLVKPDEPVKKGQPLFQFDRRPYEYKIQQLESELAAAQQKVAGAKAKIKGREAGVVSSEQDVLELKADEEVAAAKVEKLRSEVRYAKYKFDIDAGLQKTGAVSVQEVEKSLENLKANDAGLKEAEAEYARTKIKYASQIGGVYTGVIRAGAELHGEQASMKEMVAAVENVKAQLEQAKYYLENTTMLAPEDGHIVNLQVVPGMVSGMYRIGAIAAFIVDRDRYVLANFFQEHLKYVDVGQPVEVALNRYPGQIFKGKVESIWWANGEGQLLPSGELPAFNPGPNGAQTGFAVKIQLSEKDLMKCPIGSQGAAAIYTSNGGFAVLRRIVIRTYSWLNWLYPLNS